jgi:hypothetical protein
MMSSTRSVLKVAPSLERSLARLSISTGLSLGRARHRLTQQAARTLRLDWEVEERAGIC